MTPITANLWETTAGAPLDARPLAGDVEAEVVVVGGGFTGCSAALHLAEAGKDVRLLEAATIGHGGSGRNVGLVNAGLWLMPEAVEKALGQENGERLNVVLADGPSLVFSLIDRYRIACEAMRTGTLHVAHAPRGMRELRERYRQQSARGAPVELLDAGDVARRTGARGLHGALLDRRAGTIQPLAYARGLARAAIDAGATVHERTPAIDIEGRNGDWRVAAPGGSVKAKALLIAVNAYGDHFPDVWRPVIVPFHYFQMATEPLAEPLRMTILPERQGAWDTATVMSSFRLDAAGRLLFGAIGSLGSFGAAHHRAWAERKIAKLFPEIGRPAFSHAWFGRIATTPDRIPRIRRLGARGFSIFGYNGRGIAPGTVMGKAFADFVESDDEDAFPLAPVDAVKSSAAGAAEFLYELGATAFHALDAR